MKTIFFLFPLFVAFTSFAQNNLKKIKLNEKYAWNTSTQDERNNYYFGVKPVKDSKYKYHFRYEKIGQIVDVFSNDGFNFKGLLTNEIEECKTVKVDKYTTSKPSNYVFERIELDSTKSSEIGKLILETKFYLTPTDSLITSWNHNWLDCPGVDFIFKVENKYNKAAYSCLHEQNDSIELVSIIKRMDSCIENILLVGKYLEFCDKLKKGKTYTNGYSFNYYLTEKQKKRLKITQSQRNYLHTISDTITNYLKMELTRLIPNSDSIDCNERFYFYFSKSGKYLKMYKNKWNFEKLFDKEYRKCKCFLEKKLKKIQIDFVDIKYPFVRALDITSKGEILILDTTIY